MRMSEVLEIFRHKEDDHEDQSKTGRRCEDLHSIIGQLAKEVYNAVNLDVIDDDDLGSIIVGIVDDAYTSQGLPRPDFLGIMYSAGLEDDDLARAKIQAEIRKLDAQASSASASAKE